ncbi:MAG: carboxypeptidase-like regulatory domain-containing protein [Acidobacteriota bacterium]
MVDMNGAVIQGAKIALLFENTEKVSAITDYAGSFHLDQIAPGKYALQVEYPGFKLLRVENLGITTEEDQVLSLILSETRYFMGVVATESISVIESSPSAIPTEPPLPRKTKKPRP